MDRKKWTYVLMVVVAGLWGYNIYKTVKTFNNPGEDAFVIEDNVFSTIALQNDRDTFLLVLPNRDPFLDKSLSSQNQSATNASEQLAANQNQNKPSVEPAKIEPRKKWPVIEYYGFVKNRSQNHTLCVIKIDNKLHKMALGDTVDHVTIKEATRDSLHVEFFGEVKNILK